MNFSERLEECRRQWKAAGAVEPVPPADLAFRQRVASMLALAEQPEAAIPPSQLLRRFDESRRPLAPGA